MNSIYEDLLYEHCLRIMWREVEEILGCAP